MAIVISGVNNNDKITASDGTIDLLSGVTYTSESTAPSFRIGSNIQLGNAGIITATSFSGNNVVANHFINVGSNIQLGNAGVATATTFVGNLTGNVNNTGNLLLQIGGSEKFRVGGSGQLGIGGANYGTSGQVLTSGGSGSAATWSTINGTTINNNANNRLITGSGTANTLEAEANLIFDGTQLGINVSSPSYPLDVVGDGGGSFTASTNSTNGVISVVGKNSSGSVSAISRIKSYPDGSSNQSHMAFETRNSSNSMVERLRITSDGKIGIGNNNPSYPLVLTYTNNTTYSSSNFIANGLLIENTSTTDNTASGIFFTAKGSGANAGAAHINCIRTANGSGTLTFSTRHNVGNHAERVRITSDGKMGIKTSTPIGTLDVYDGTFVLSKPNASGNERNWRFVNNNVAAGNLGLQVSTAAGGSSFANLVEITKNGYIGIGEGTPDRRLHLKEPAQIKLESTSTGNWSGLEFMASSGTNNYDAYMGMNDSDGVFFIDNNSNGHDFIIDRDGRITKPNQPSCMAFNPNGQMIAGGATAAFSSTRFNIGSHYNTSNGRFTAPIAGRYLVAYSGLHDYQGQSQAGFSIQLNGSDFNGGEAYDDIYGSSDNHQCQLAKTLILNMSVNDYVSIYVRSSGTRIHQRYGSFSVCLLT